MAETPDSEYDELQYPGHHPNNRVIAFIDGVSRNLSRRGEFSYSTVYDRHMGFQHIDRQVFVPGQPVIATITSTTTASQTGNIFTSRMYQIDLKHCNFEWTVHRRYAHFLNLHRQLKMHQASLKIPLPTKSHREKRRSFRAVVKTVQTFPKFPLAPETLITEDKLARRVRQLQDYLNGVLCHPQFRNYHETATFLEVSNLSFVQYLGIKRKEGVVKKRGGGDRVAVGCRAFLNPLRAMFASWMERWLLLKETYLIVVRPKDGVISEVILLDNRFGIRLGYYKTGRKTGITITNQNRTMTICAPTRERTTEWFDDITFVENTTGKEFIQPNRFGSYSPVRNNILAKWFVDGADYFAAVADALESAKDEIFITDWMLSPELLLKRPTERNFWRLDYVLERKAHEGVKIFVLLYKEIEMTLGINSDYARKRLSSLHPTNIKVIRHPDHVRSNVLLWGNHEKIVVIDQTYAFVGGLDLCFGRWDNHEHRLIDIGRNEEMHPDRHFILSSFNVSSVVNALSSIAFPVISDFTDVDEVDNRSVVLRPVRQSQNLQGQQYMWPGKDYMNFMAKDFRELDAPLHDLIDRTAIPRMPWHDVGVMVQGTIARDIARHFIQRWNTTKITKLKEDHSYPLLLPRSYVNMTVPPPFTDQMTNVNCQVLRSVSSWSASTTDTENSIHQAYVDVIKNAKHFIYIENQFFITIAGNEQSPESIVTNGIAKALLERIKRAHRAKEIFRIYVVMPLLPAFEGELGTQTGHAKQAITKYNYASMCRGPGSLYARLAEEVGDPLQYLTFYGLRTYDVADKQPVTELVYVHSKLIIVDDIIAIIGSSNINDRSLRGDRDSEIAVIIEDVETFPSKMAHMDFQAGNFVGRLRRHIFSEHLGMLNSSDDGVDISDPVSEKFFKEQWLKIASRNTAIFEKVFNCVPNDSIRNFADLRQWDKVRPLAESNPEEAAEKLSKVQGHLVLMPLQFLCDESLTPPANSKEGIVPVIIWT